MCSFVPQFQATPCPMRNCCPDKRNESICSGICTEDLGNWSKIEECEREKGIVASYSA